jgi:hypothetical protein
MTLRTNIFLLFLWTDYDGSFIDILLNNVCARYLSIVFNQLSYIYICSCSVFTNNYKKNTQLIMSELFLTYFPERQGTDAKGVGMRNTSLDLCVGKGMRHNNNWYVETKVVHGVQHEPTFHVTSVDYVITFVVNQRFFYFLFLHACTPFFSFGGVFPRGDILQATVQ